MKINWDGFFQSAGCSASQYDAGQEKDLLREMMGNKRNYRERNNSSTLDGNDVVTGFKILSALKYCPSITYVDKMKPYKFLVDLVSTHSLPVILRSTVSALELGIHNVELMAFYDELDKMMGLQYLRIKSQDCLNGVLKKYWPPAVSDELVAYEGSCKRKSDHGEGE